MNRILLFTLLAFAVLLTLCIRLFPYESFVNPDGGFYFYNVDSYDHLRRITLSMASFPHFIARDMYANYPEGLGQIWSPLFDYVHAGISLLLGGSREIVETVCFLSNPLIAALTVCLIFFIASRAFGSIAAGIAAAFLLAVNPGHISRSIPMNFDHHVMEPLALLFLIALPLLEKKERLSLKAALVAASVIDLTVFFWRGITMYWAILFVALLIRFFLSGSGSLAKSYAGVFMVSALLLAPVCLLNPWQTASGFSFEAISWFHVSVLASFAGIMFFLGNTGKGWRLATVLVTLIALLAITLIPTVRSLSKEVIKGVYFIFRTDDPWLQSITEQKIIFSNRGFFESAGLLTMYWFLSPLSVYFSLRDWKRNRPSHGFSLNYAVWSPVLLLGLIIRYSVHTVIYTSLAGGHLFALAWTRWNTTRHRAMVAFISVLLLIPGYGYYADGFSRRLPSYMLHGLYGKGGVLEWIRLKTPKTSHYLDPSKMPEYGILASWYNGARIYQLAERPAVAIPFRGTSGIYKQAGFMSTSDPDIASTIARENKIKYLLLDALYPYSSSFAVARDGMTKGILSPGTVTEPSPETSMNYRLMFFDGSSIVDTGSGTFYSALENYRLVHESAYRRKNRRSRTPLSFYKVFEFVKGATLRGRGKPGTAVEVEVRLATSQGRPLVYRNRKSINENGVFSFLVPYATTQKNGDLQAVGGYRITGDGLKTYVVQVTENDILHGKVIDLSEPSM